MDENVNIMAATQGAKIEMHKNQVMIISRDRKLKRDRTV